MSTSRSQLKERARKDAARRRIDGKLFYAQYEPFATTRKFSFGQYEQLNLPDTMHDVRLKCRCCGFWEDVKLTVPPGVVVRRVEKITCRACVRSRRLSRSSERGRLAKAALDSVLGLAAASA